ncbi:MAG TPA: pilus assembly protein [Mesorhizobium sp.]|jgi:Flp pilus assembly protein TadG|nr:pilus assembly protein [Mesorhizobium sp.]
MRKAAWKAFGGNEGGNFAVTFAVASTLIVSAAGFAVDTANLYRIRTSLQGALDAAVTSTARDLTTGKIAEKDARSAVERFLSTNGVGTLGQDKAVLESLVVDRAERTVEASARIDVDLFFPFLDEDGRAEVAVGSAALYSDRRIEVAMMLDVTGSMEGQKIEDLKTAASNAVKAFLGSQDPRNPRVRVAIVPYAEAVNVGALASVAVFDEKAAGGANLPAPEDAVLKASAGASDRCATERRLQDGTADASDDSPYDRREHVLPNKFYRAKVNRDDRLGACPKAQLVALTADRAKLLRTVEDFSAAGVTAGGIAAQWGYYMLSPKWRSAIKDAGMGQGPANHDGRQVAKVAVLMTDGLFNTAFAGVPDGETDRTCRKHSRTTPQGCQPGKARNHALAVCEAMKKSGIEVFTIGFALDDPKVSKAERDQARALLKNCASPDASGYRHFFDASTGAELDAALQEVVGNVERLAVTR